MFANVPSRNEDYLCDPDIAAMYSRLQEGYSAPLKFIIQRAVQSSELPRQQMSRC